MQLKHKTSRWLGGIVVLGLVASGCSGATSSPKSNASQNSQEEAQPNDSFLDQIGGKGDRAYNIEPGSSNAQALLDFVNSASHEKLDDDVSLDVRAADNIVAARSDGKIASLKELDGVAWVGSRAFRKLVDYCRTHGIFGDGSGSNAVHGVTPGSPEADAMLKLANTASESKLDDTVSLDARAAKHIVDYRNGEDGRTGTDDDRTFDSLNALAAITWVGSRAFTKMLDYLRSNDKISKSISEDSARALGAFYVANTTSESKLQSAVGLSQAAAAEIVRHRENFGGNTIESLKELRGIEKVDDASIRTLADHAEANGNVPDTYFEIPWGSRRAHGMVKAANELSRIQLSSTLTGDAVDDIIDYREGHDGRSGTDDDRTFNSIDELAGLSNFSDVDSSALLSKAENRGFVPPPHWRDLLPEGRIETYLDVVAWSCHDDDVDLDRVSPSDTSSRRIPRFLEENARYRMFGDNPGRLSVRFHSDIHDSMIPEQRVMDFRPNGTFSGGYHDQHSGTWSQIEHDGRIDRRGTLTVKVRSTLHDVNYNAHGWCKVKVELP